MIARLSGVLRERQPGRVIVETGGIGYELQVPLLTFYRLPPSGTLLTLEVRQVVREDSLTLYGFSSAAEKQAFDLLTQVQQVGPRLALAVLSVMSPRELTAAVSQGDVGRLDAAPGVGAKVAERIVRELRDRIAELHATLAVDLEGAQEPGVGDAPDAGAQLREDAVSALVNLGYRPAEARRAAETALARAQGDPPQFENLLREALALLLGQR